MRRTSKLLTLAVGAALLIAAAGCGSSDDSADPAEPVTTASTIATGETTATTPTTRPTTAKPATTATTAKPATTDKPKPTTAPATPVKAVPKGSGCAPGAGSLPDGTWYGYIVGTQATGFDFDLACFFEGKPAAAAALEDGKESPPPNDYYIRNANEDLRSLKADSGGSVIWYPNLGDPGSKETTTYSAWKDLIEGRGTMPGVWLQVGNGVVVSINEQWVP